MRSLMAATLAVVLVGSAVADDKKDAKKDAKPTGTWVKGDGDNKITFEFKGEQLLITVAIGGNEIKAESAYGVTKDKVVFGYMTKVEPGGDQGPQVGDLFSFKFETKGDAAELSELKGTHVNDGAKQAVEGEYKKK